MEQRSSKTNPHTPGHYVMEGEIDGKPFTREFVAIEDYNVLQGHYADLLALAKQYASECSGCDGEGRILVTFNDREAEYDPCEDCADIRAVIAKAESGHV